jgi:hypothetical protein
MSKNHIPAPWTHFAGTGDIYKDGHLIASVRLNSRDIEPEERATAQRIVQCVNALEEFENPTQLVEDYKSMKSLLKEMLRFWDRGDSIPANCVYPNAVRFQLGLEPKVVERKKVVEEKSNPSGKMVQEEMDFSAQGKRIEKYFNRLRYESEASIKHHWIVSIQDVSDEVIAKRESHEEMVDFVLGALSKKLSSSNS